MNTRIHYASTCVAAAFLLAITGVARAENAAAEEPSRNESTSSKPAPGDAIVIEKAQVTTIEEVPLAAAETGLISEILCKPGEVVEEGALLAKLDDTRAKLQLNEAQFEFSKADETATNDVEIRAAQKSLEVTRAELKRSQEAVERYSKSISKTEIDRLRLAVERAELAEEQAELTRKLAGLDADLRQNQVAMAKHTLERHRIHTPISGVVIQSTHHPGEWVETGKPVFRILRLDRLRCERRVDASLVNRSMIGRPIEVAVLLPNGETLRLPGTLTFVDAQISPISGDVLVWAEFDNPKLQALPGMKAEIHIPKTSEPAKATRPSKQ